MTTQTKINQSDLKFYPSERLEDTPEGGGLALGTAIQGKANEIFNPISTLARTNGDFSARLVYAGVGRDDDTPLIGSFVAITKPPADPATSYLLFGANFGELRQDGIKRIENFNVKTIQSKMTLLSNPARGSKIVQAYQRVGEPAPNVGDVYCLDLDKQGYTKALQYIQIASVKSEVRKFYDPDTRTDFERVVLTLETSQILAHDFVGASYPSQAGGGSPTLIRETHVADAARYYGIKPLVEPLGKNRQTLKVASLMDKIVPTSQIETPLADLSATGVRDVLIKSAKKPISIDLYRYHYPQNITSIHTGNAVLAGSVKLSYGSGVITDVGGTLMMGDLAVGTVDYARGLLTITAQSQIELRVLEFVPSGVLRQVSDTAKISVSINNRSYNYVLTLSPAPAVGSVLVSYRAQGQWYDLRDVGGKLQGVSGGGSINYATGTLALSLSELPDVGSDILISYGTTARHSDRSGAVVRPKGLLTLPKEVNSLTLTWSGGRASMDATGKLTGNLTGVVRGTQIVTDTLLSRNTQMTATYHTGEKIHQEHKAPLRDGTGKVPIDLGDKVITRGSVRLRYNLLIQDYDTEVKGEVVTRSIDPYKTLRDDGAGKLVDETGKAFGTIDYDARRILLSPDTTVKIPKARYSKVKIGETVLSVNTAERTKQVQDTYRVAFTGIDYVEAMASMPIDESALVEVWFFDKTEEQTSTLVFDTVVIDLLPDIAETIVPSSVLLGYGSQYTGGGIFDKNGKLCVLTDIATGAIKVVGSINYANAQALLKEWSNSYVLHSLASSSELHPVDGAYFRTPIAPIRPQSLQIHATATDGTSLTAIANARGELKGKGIDGTVDVETGVVSVRFGNWVAAEGKQDEPWYNPDALVEAKIFAPKPVLASSIVFNAVAYSHLPIASELIKIDSVRLPQDGRVPIFRRGDTLLISDSQSQNLGSAFTAGQTIELPRQNLDRICLKDSKDTPVDAKLWDYDLKNGTISFATPLDLSGYTLPLVATHTLEEKNRLVQADIDGTLSLMFPTRHAYPRGSYVSSVLIGGDLEVRHSVPFVQKNWDNVWSDTRQGEPILNKLNLKDHPMVLTDDGAITERWAIVFTSANQFELYGETLGFVARTDTLQDLAPMNPNTKKPYFTIPRQAFGADAPWATRNMIRFNTWGSLVPLWVLRAVQPTNQAQEGEDGFVMCLFGDTTAI